MQEEQTGVSLSEIGRVLRKRSVLIVLLSMIAAVVAAVIFAFWIDPAREDFVFVLRNGYSPPADLVTGENVRAAASDARFASLDVGKIEKGATFGRTETGGTLSLPGREFPDFETAWRFADALAEAAAERQAAAEAAGGTFLPDRVYGEVPFEEQLLLLSEEKEALLSRVDEWIRLLGGSYVAGGSTLAAVRAELLVTYADSVARSLSEELAESCYAPVKFLAERRARLTAEYEQNTRAAAAVGVAGETLAGLLARNAYIDYYLENTLTEDASRAFAARIETERASLAAAEERVSALASELYGEELARYTVESGERKGGISPVLAAAGAFLLTAVVCVVAFTAAERRREGG